MIDELTILGQLKGQEIKAFKMICVEFSAPLEDYAFTLIGDANKARTVVEDVLGVIWVTNAFSNVSPPIIEYLREEVRKRCLQENR